MRQVAEELDRSERTAGQQLTRQRLLDAARDVFLRTGYQGAKLDDIASVAGFTKGAVYWHFPNKQALFVALIRDSIDRNMGILDDLLAIGANDPQRLKDKIGAWIDVIDEQETLPTFGAELEIESRRDPSFRAIHQQMISGHEASLTEFLKQYFRLIGEEPSMPVDQLASSIITIFKGFALARQNRTSGPVTSAKAVRALLGLPLSV